MKGKTIYKWNTRVENLLTKAFGSEDWLRMKQEEKIGKIRYSITIL